MFYEAQTNNDPLYINYSVMPNQKMDKYDNEASLQVLETNVILPKFQIGKKTSVYTNVNYKVSMYDYAKSSDLYEFPKTLNDARIGLIIRNQLSEKWELIVSPRLNLRTDYKESFSDGLFPNVNVLAIKNVNPDLVWGFGATYNNDLDKNTILPMLYLKYHKESFRIYSILPSFAYFIMTPANKKLEYGLSYNLDGQIFNVKNIPLTENPNYLKTLNVTIAPTIGYNISKKLWLNAKVGYGLFRNYQFLDSEFENIGFKENNRLNSSFYASVGISFRTD